MFIAATIEDAQARDEAMQKLAAAATALNNTQLHTETKGFQRFVAEYREACEAVKAIEPTADIREGSLWWVCNFS